MDTYVVEKSAFTGGGADIKRNVFALAIQGEAYYLPDGGAIEFFMHDKPVEFYGTQACLARNRFAPGEYVVRVPAGTAVYRIADYKGLFESRKPFAARNAEYIENGPYVHEREVGINCGISEITTETSTGVLGKKNPRTAMYASSNNGSYEGRNDYYYIPAPHPSFAVYPEYVNRVQTYLDTTASVMTSSIAGSDDCNPEGSTGGSSLFPGSANELYIQRQGSSFENNNTEFQYGNENSGGYDLHVNSGGYGRMFLAPVTHQAGRRYINQNYETGGDSGIHNQGQHGSFIPVIPARPVNDASATLPPRHLNKKTNALYKTEMCRNWNEIGECRYGRSCQFAHGKKELRTVPRHGQWKTKTCMAWLHGGCTYGSRCCYAHEIIDDHGHPQSRTSTELGANISLGDAGESKFSEFFASPGRKFWPFWFHSYFGTQIPYRARNQ